MNIVEEASAVAQAEDRRLGFLVLLHDMRYLAKSMRRYEGLSYGDPRYAQANSYMRDTSRRLGKKYNQDTLGRMKRIVARTYKLTSYRG
jgi:hypothetical protein